MMTTLAVVAAGGAGTRPTVGVTGAPGVAGAEGIMVVIWTAGTVAVLVMTVVVIEAEIVLPAAFVQGTVLVWTTTMVVHCTPGAGGGMVMLAGSEGTTTPGFCGADGAQRPAR